MKIVLFGKNGQVGQQLQRSLLPLGELVAYSRQEVELDDTAQIEAVLREQAPDVIVNASAYTAVDRAESEEAQATAINAEAVATLAHHAKQSGALLVHYSTDYVFDGTKTTPYVEDNATAPLNAYGRSKLAGEQAILESGCDALILRTSWVVSGHGQNFIRTILKLAQTRPSLNVVDDQIGAPTAAELIADVTLLAIHTQRAGQLAIGLYHLTAAGACSWHELACHTVAYAQARNAYLLLAPEAIQAIPSSGYPTPAQRPKNSRLDSTRLSHALQLQLPDWRLHVNRAIDHILSREGAS